MLQRITREEGLSTIIVEQNARKIMAMTDCAAILERGSIVYQSDSATLRADRPILERFLGVAANPGARRGQR